MLKFCLFRMNKHVVLFFPPFFVPFGVNNFPSEDTCKGKFVRGPWSNNSLNSSLKLPNLRVEPKRNRQWGDDRPENQMIDIIYCMAIRDSRREWSQFSDIA